MQHYYTVKHTNASIGKIKNDWPEIDRKQDFKEYYFNPLQPDFICANFCVNITW